MAFVSFLLLSLSCLHLEKNSHKLDMICILVNIIDTHSQRKLFILCP